MNYVNAVIEDKAAFEHALDTPLPVFVVFMSAQCRACEDALPRFMQIAASYQHSVKVLILDCTQTPRHPSVTRIPMLLVYHNHQLLETQTGLGQQSLEDRFQHYAQVSRVARAQGAL